MKRTLEVTKSTGGREGLEGKSLVWMGESVVARKAWSGVSREVCSWEQGQRAGQRKPGQNRQEEERRRLFFFFFFAKK